MDRKHNTDIVPLAKQLRKNMTPWERKLWYEFLRRYPVKFLRQKPLGKYIADFYCAKANVIIELDGSQHYDHIHIKRDTERTAYFEQFGIRVIRIPNNQVYQDFQGVCEYIHNLVQQSLSQLR